MAVETSPETQANKELSLWDIIQPVRGSIYIGMALSAISGIAWIVALVLLRPVADEVLSATLDTVRLLQLCVGILVAMVIGFVLRVLSFRWSHLGAYELE
ncbi:MAG: hypothetical protein AAFR67_01840, partial [Chloroflexota bacterium]